MRDAMSSSRCWSARRPRRRGAARRRSLGSDEGDEALAPTREHPRGGLKPENVARALRRTEHERHVAVLDATAVLLPRVSIDARHGAAEHPVRTLIRAHRRGRQRAERRQRDRRPWPAAVRRLLLRPARNHATAAEKVAKHLAFALEGRLAENEFVEDGADSLLEALLGRPLLVLCLALAEDGIRLGLRGRLSVLDRVVLRLERALVEACGQVHVEQQRDLPV